MPAFDITATPTLQAVASTDERVLASDLQKRVDEAIQTAEDQPAVVDASQAHHAAEELVSSLHTAARTLNETAREMRAQSSAVLAKTLEKLIKSAASGGKPDYSHASRFGESENRERLTGRALERVVEHLTPLAQVARLRAESHALLTRARAIEEAAQQRAEKVLGQLRGAVSDEMVLPVDMSKGVAGALLSHAVELKRRAVVAATGADEIEKRYMERIGKDGRA